MGFDVSGINPIINKSINYFPMKIKWQDVDWNKRKENPEWEKDKDKYLKEVDGWHKANPGIYFRNNVWYWRPLWGFICRYCSDILSQKQMTLGRSNDGVKIYKTKAKRLAARIRRLDKEGVIKDIQAKHEADRMIALKHNKKIEKELKLFHIKMRLKYGNDIVPANYNEVDKALWDTIYERKMYEASYPFSRNNVLEFGKFCDESGGFQIW